MARRKKIIKLVRGVNMPIEAVTQTFGFMGIKESGKTYAGTKLAEEMIGVGAQIVVLDPVGKWWGLRLDADGKSPGIDIPLLGGLHGDMPLGPNAGELVAKVIIESGTSAILDVSTMRKNMRKKFVTEFAEAFFHLRAQDPAACHMFFEESHLFAPQRESGQEQMLGAIEDIVRLGRNHGIGSTLIDQRPQSVNKNVLNQVECLIALRLIGKHERRAIMDWISHKGADVKEMADNLPSLETGDCMLWSPSWLRTLKKTRVLEKWTFDASATPKVGVKKRQRRLTKLDLGELSEAMEEIVNDAEKNDPKAMRKKIAQLEKRIRFMGEELATATENGKDDPEMARKYQELHGKATAQEVLIKQLHARVEHIADTKEKICKGMSAAIAQLVESVNWAEALDRGQARVDQAPVIPKLHAPQPKTPRAAPRPMTENSGNGDSKLAGVQQKIVDAIAWWEAVGVPDPSRGQVAFVASSSMSGHFKSSVSRLNVGGIVHYPQSGHLALTDEGRMHARAPSVPPTTEKLHHLIRAQLNGLQARMFDAITAAYPSEMSREELADAAGSPQSGHFKSTVSRMHTLGIFHYPRNGYVQAEDILFL